MRLALAVGLCAVACARHPLAGASPDAQLSFPRDDGAHLAQTEWWHFHGHLRDEAGERYDFFLAFVRWHTDEDRFLGIPVRWAVDPGQLAFFSLTDRAARRFRFRDRYAFPDVWAASARTGRLGLVHGDFLAEVDAASVRLRGSAQGARLSLELSPSGPRVLQGQGGRFVRDGTDSSFYTQPRLQAAGRLDVDGKEKAVRGEVWFKHQWGFLYGPEVVGWVWLGIQLDSGQTMQVALVKERGWYQGQGSFAEVVEPDGQVRALALEQLGVMQTGEVWTSPRTGVQWPVGWRLDVPERQGVLELTAPVREQELAVFPSPMWAGALEVTGHLDGEPARGQAMAEVFGLDEPFLRSFFTSGAPRGEP